DPPLPDDRDWERPAILVELSGPDGGLFLERNAEGLRALEHIAQQMLRLTGEEHERVAFDSQGYRAVRLPEVRTAAAVAAGRLRSRKLSSRRSRNHPRKTSPSPSKKTSTSSPCISWCATRTSG